MAMPVIMFPSVFINCFAILLVPEFSRYFVKKDTLKIRKMSILILSITLIFSIFIGIIIFYFAKPLSNLLYKKSDIAQYIKILSFLIPFIYLDLVIDNILKGLDAQVSVVFINIADCLITISFIYFVVPCLGFIGYIISIFISEIFNIILSLGQLILIIYKQRKVA
jgi:stage V sporulation protein B